MRHIELNQRIAFAEKSEWFMPAAALLAVAFIGLTLANGVPTTTVTAPTLRQAASPVALVPPSAQPVAKPGQVSVARVAPAQQPVAKPLAQSEELDRAIPVADAVKSRGLLAALLALEAEGDTTETSEGLDSIASPAAVNAELFGADPQALASETPAPAPRKDNIRLLVASVDSPVTYQ